MFDLSSARFAFLDLETTGLSPWFGDRICEVGIVITEGKRIKHQYQQLVNPERPLSPGAASTNGLTDAELMSAPVFAEVVESVTGSLKDAVVVCHNAQFDVQFLDSEFKRLGRDMQIPNLIDTLNLARRFFDLPSNSLHSIAEAFHVPMTGAHRALDDALTARGIFFSMMDRLKQLNKTQRSRGENMRKSLYIFCLVSEKRGGKKKVLFFFSPPICDISTLGKSIVFSERSSE